MVKPLTESIVQYDLVVAIGEDACIPILEQGKHKLHQAYCYIAASPSGKGPDFDPGIRWFESNRRCQKSIEMIYMAG